MEKKEVYYTAEIQVQPDQLLHVPNVIKQYLDLVESGFLEEDKEIAGLKVILEFDAKEISTWYPNPLLDVEFWVDYATGRL